jgi:hypothetical protein
MALTADNVRIAVTGGIYFAEDPADLPTGVGDTLAGDFDEVGYVSEDGITETIEESRNRIRAWQNNDTVREVQTEHDYLLSFTALETNDVTLALYYGNHTAGVSEIRGGQNVRGSWVFDIHDGDELVTIVVPDGEITNRDAINRRNGEATQYGMQVTCYPDEDGVKAYVYTGQAGS